MAMNVNNWWYNDPAQRYNDVIFPQNERAVHERDWRHGGPPPKGRGAHERDFGNYDRKASSAGKVDDTPTRDLSPAAQKLLDKLKKTYDNVDFSVAGSNNSADAKAKLAGGSGKYSVLFTNDELEKMAADEKYQKSMLNKMHEGFRTVASARADMGFSAGNAVSRVGIIYNSDGTSSMYKDMLDSADAQKPHIEKQNGSRAAQKNEYFRRFEAKRKELAGSSRAEYKGRKKVR